MKTNLKRLTVVALVLVSFSFVNNFSNYTLDVGHTHVGFEVERFLVGEVEGRFNDFNATISMEGEDYTTLAINAIINVNSLDSNNETRDGHLKGEMWLDANTYPEIVFQSTSVKKESNDKYSINGKMTIKGVTKEINFPIEILGPFKDPTQKEAIGIKADFTLNRFDYGIKFNKKMDNGSFFIGDVVKIKLRALTYKE